MYHNEADVGRAVSKFLSSAANTTGLKREDIHFTSKLASNSDYDTARRSIKKSVKECGLGYIDLFLLHSPYGGKKARLESWRAVEDAVMDGEVRIGGVSNYGVKHVSSEVPSVRPCIHFTTSSPFRKPSWTVSSPFPSRVISKNFPITNDIRESANILLTTPSWKNSSPPPPVSRPP